MRIIIPLLGPFGKAGGFRVLSNLANHWIDAGHKVSFLSYVNTDPPYFPTKANILYYNKNGKLISKTQTDTSKALLGMLQLRRSLKKVLDICEADIVLANHCFTALPIKQSKIKAKKFYYVQAYEPEYYYKNTLKDFIFKKISKNSYNLGLDIIVNAEMYKDYKNLKSTKVVFPGMDLEIFQPNESKETSNTQKKIILGTIGRLEAYKGTNYVLEAFKILRNELGDCVELHVGFGEKVMEITEGVKVMFPNGDKGLADYYRSLDVYICAGIVQLDAIHYPILESMACKVPVITTGYYPATDENAYLVPIKDVEAIKNKVLEVVMSHKNQNKIEKAYADIKQFDWNHIANKMLNYFEN